MPRFADRLEGALISVWYGARRPPFGLQLLSYVFRGASTLRRAAYRRGVLPSSRLAAPVIVVGNITVGGSGKTPFTIWLAKALRDRGIRPGIVTRGYGGQARYWPRDVTPASVAAEVGDEAVLLARATQCPVVAGPDRAAAAARLLDREHVDVVIADDGLQHYGLARDFEVATIDGERGLGNGCLLPAGPLRETAARLDRVDCIVIKGDASRFALPGALSMTLVLTTARSLANGSTRPLESFRGTAVHAVAGIGNPEQFFAALRAQCLELIAHPFPDHAALGIEDFEFGDDRPVLMTEKDAVKLAGVADERLWAVPAEARLPQAEAEDLLARIAGLVRVK